MDLCIFRHCAWKTARSFLLLAANIAGLLVARKRGLFALIGLGISDSNHLLRNQQFLGEPWNLHTSLSFCLKGAVDFVGCNIPWL